MIRIRDEGLASLGFRSLVSLGFSKNECKMLSFKGLFYPLNKMQCLEGMFFPQARESHGWTVEFQHDFNCDQ